MKRTQVQPDGKVRCPNCGATSFDTKRTGKAKLTSAAVGAVTLGAGGVAAIAVMPKRIRCLGCGTNLKTGK